MRNPRKTSLRCWPFWLLVLAWMCANGPQAVTFEAKSWVKRAGTFSHQERLAAEVDRAMNEKAAPVQVAASARGGTEHHEVPAMPAETVIKKLLLATQSPVRTGALDARGRDVIRGFDWSLPAALAVEAPFQPPRGGPLA